MEPAGTAPREGRPFRARPGAYGELLAAFGKLGLTSFGGPVAHLGYFRAELVERRRWLTDAEYADLVALCQFLPGPASSQVVFAIGMQRAGVLGGLLASACFTLPSALALVAFGYGVATAGDLGSAGWLHGLKLAAVAIVAQAVRGMGATLCPDRARRTVCICAAALLLFAPGAVAQVGVIAAGAVAGWVLYRREIDASGAGPGPREGALRAHPAAAGALFAFLGLLVLLPALSAATGSRSLAVFDGFYRPGALVFGGGHVVLPLLRAEVVPNGWVSDDRFLAGYGAAQAVPGPLFTFAAYLGTVMSPGPSWRNGAWCLLAIFLPAWLLIGGALPFWARLRSRTFARAALRGANAAVVGVLLAALYHPVVTGSVHDVRDAAVALVAFGALVVWNAPPWAVVLALAALGEWVLA